MILNKIRNQALNSVKRNGSNLRFLSQELRNDREIVLAAIKQNINVLNYVNQNLFNSWNSKKIYLLLRDMSNNDNILNNNIIKLITRFL